MMHLIRETPTNFNLMISLNKTLTNFNTMLPTSKTLSNFNILISTSETTNNYNIMPSPSNAPIYIIILCFYVKKIPTSFYKINKFTSNSY